MRRVAVLVIAALFFYALLRDMSLVKVLILCAALFSAYAISRIPSRYLFRGKYPLICLCLALSPALFFYPALRPLQFTAGAAILSGFYGIGLFLAGMEEKGKEVYKEIIGLSVLYGASVVNLVLTGHPELVVPLSISAMLFLFIINKAKVMPYVAVYTAATVAFFLVKGIPVLGPRVPLHAVEHYLVLSCAFLLLFITFVTFVKKTDFVSIVAFFGLLYVSVDLLMSIGFRLKGVLLYQPVLALCVLGPLVGIMLKGGGQERL